MKVVRAGVLGDGQNGLVFCFDVKREIKAVSSGGFRFSVFQVFAFRHFTEPQIKYRPQDNSIKEILIWRK